MPAIIDHDQRRSEIASAVEAIVSRTGVQTVTIREVGREAGFSPTVISHYFQNKLELMTFTYVNARLRSIRRVEEKLSEGATPFTCLAECLPTDAARQSEWKVWFGYWGMAAENPSLMEEQHKGVKESWSLFSRVFTAARIRGEIAADTDIGSLATRAQYLLDGIACLALQQPEQWPAQRQRDTFQAELELVP